jgi:hypothetical protein
MTPWKTRCAIAIGLALLTAAAALVGHRLWTRPRPVGPLVIFQGVTYACEERHEPECSGLIMLVRIDLTAPGIGLYLTPVDAEATSRGFQYRLIDVPTVVRREDLAVAINGTFFRAASGMVYRSGDLADSVQTVIVDGQVNHIDPHSYMLWFDSDVTPHIETEKPPSRSVLGRARWGIGGGAVPLARGTGWPAAASCEVDRRTAVAIDSQRRLLWLAVFENASSLAAARILAEHGARDGFLLDGGHSTVMAFGPKVAGVRAGTVFGGARPVATVLGIKADPLRTD